ncbi:CHAD domain-containing protein [Novosphingobium album (ex Liu et al. 2023)]|uniref:CHAD domain-containing protein n=1 Tax=Novosphingobium album (ex Liu et al. 2023) TaxID=3031130 RepID=A0ABT5WSI9_9SPHN|nr:CHAD domain-containing protein [Novosphingobium album (ex Liu et al. 2023)]MDE8653014.1 CHAD domain-containing protein [Novosphingobium album (ex Liu et al. 2023)]
MAFRVKGKDGTVQSAVRRIACEQIDAALAAVDGQDDGDVVHDVRKRCKKLRGLVRLVRPSFPGYARENAAFRDIAGLISAARDARVMQDTYDALVEHFHAEVDRRALGSIRRRFTLQRKGELADDGSERALPQVRARLLEARERAAAWRLDDDGWAAVSGGLEKTYRQARKAAAAARANPHDEAFHELRKHVKYHWSHCLLLEGLWRPMLVVRQDAALSLSELLGDHHDLSVFAHRLDTDPLAYGRPGDVVAAIGLARRRQAELEAKAWPLAGRLLAQSPEQLGDHFGALWKVWRSAARAPAEAA